MNKKNQPVNSELHRLYVTEKMDAKTIGKMFNVNPVTVCQWLKKAEIPRRGRGRDQSQYPTKDQLLSVWNGDQTVEQVAKTFNISLGTLYRLKDNFNLPPKPIPDMSGPNSPTWKGGRSEYYGPNWESQRKACLRRDRFTCRRCGLTQEQTGKEPDVHHLIPIRTFNKDYDRANALPNLVSLCSCCHQFVEHNPTIPIPAEPDPSLQVAVQVRKGGYVQPLLHDPQEVARRYMSGEKIHDTMAAMGISTPTAYYRYLRRAGIEPGRVTKINRDLLKSLIASGVPRKEASKQSGCSLLHSYKVVPAQSAV